MLLKPLKSKKAAVFLFFVLFGIFAGITAFFISSFNTISPQGAADFVGQRQLYTIQASKDAQKYLLFIDQAAELSAEKAVQDFTDGGYALASPCKTYKGYQLWTSTYKKCFPFDYKTQFKALFSKYFNEYLPDLKDLQITQTISIEYLAHSLSPQIPSIKYDFFVKENQITGIADSEIKIDMIEIDKSIGTYYIRPSFNIQTDHNIDRFEEIIIQAQTLVTKCKASIDLKACLGLHTPPAWVRGTCEGDITIEKQQSAFCVRLHGLAYKFALDFS
ncbi:hypothetical protein KY332_03200 [Candidatus Woesearchaeota archaeon]|nr:hypothetical protein [Candidatus Woesearchaeota archaeon]